MYHYYDNGYQRRKLIYKINFTTMGVKKRKKLTKKQIEKNKVMNLFVSNLDGIEIVQLKTEYSTMFINRFGLETIPTKERFLEFKNSIN